MSPRFLYLVLIACAAGGPPPTRGMETAVRVEVGDVSYTPQHRFLSEDEGVEVAGAFLREHPHRALLASRILGWPDLLPEPARREFVRSHPFVASGRPSPEPMVGP